MNNSFCTRYPFSIHMSLTSRREETMVVRQTPLDPLLSSEKESRRFKIMQGLVRYRTSP
ncbi:hypothetical protein M413DRAFT_391777 [Hebeloma cylindrosporum]|uniref:Uncharacterized protein n=1 Tax=Hebeloma cylindrosporum TaxID=76867 RepID=A0A0C3BTW5_HEBCY|nr:hypothetical protein M413DRAFT_391777 [Hebeloma cylindrosporum h7]